jgi:hypothetical protein
MITGAAVATCGRTWFNSANLAKGWFRVSDKLRILRCWLLVSLALPETNPDRAELVEQTAVAFLVAWRHEMRLRKGTTSLGPVAEA